MPLPWVPVLPVKSPTSCILPLLFSIPLCLLYLSSFIFSPHMWFCSPSLCTPSPPLSSLSHIWFLSSGLCVFGVTQSSVGLPANMYVCFADDDRAMACVCVRLQAHGLGCSLCNTFQMRHFTLFVSRSLVLPSSKSTSGSGAAAVGPHTLTCLGDWRED